MWEIDSDILFSTNLSPEFYHSSEGFIIRNSYFGHHILRIFLLTFEIPKMGDLFLPLYYTNTSFELCYS